MKIAYLVPEAPIGYGPRIYIPYNLIDAGVRGFMEKNSMWGGHDRDTGKCFGWEFPNPESNFYMPEDLEKFEKAKRYLLVRGFKLENQSEQNQDQVWA